MSNQKKNKNVGSTSGGRVRTADAAKAKKVGAKSTPTKGGAAKNPLKDSNNRIAIILVAAVLATVLVAGAVIGIIAIVKHSKAKEEGATADYLSFEDVAKYISVPESAYKGLLVENNVDPVTEQDVEMAILKLLVKNKNKTAKENGKFLKNMTVTAGDIVLIYYLGYTLDEDGNALLFDGGCNFGAATDDIDLEIGSGSFINGFELGLIGKNAKDYDTLTTITYDDACNGFADGEIKAGDVISLTYTVMHPSGKTDIEKTAIIDLGSPTTDKTYGDGFTSKLIGKKINEMAGVSIGADVDGGRLGYTDLKVNAIYRYGDNPLTVEAYFPYDFREESLRGKTAYYDVFIDYSQLYDTPEWNDTFITETLKVTEESLSEYEGSTVTEKYENYLRVQLDKEYEAAVNTLIENELWDSIIKGASVIKLPAGDVTAQYNAYYNSYVEGYNKYGAMYGYSSVDEYACIQMNLKEGTDWKAMLKLQAEDIVTQKLAFYYVVNKEGFTPSEAELSELVADKKEEVLNSYLESADCKRENYDTEEKYLKAVEGYRKTLDSQYDYAYYAENVYYEYGMERLRALAGIKP